MCTAKHTSVWCIVCNNPGSSSIVLKSEIESGPKRPLDPSSASNTMKADHTDLYSYLETLPSLPIFKPSVHNTSFCLKAVSECQALDPKPPGGAVSTTSYVLCSTHRRAGEHRLSLREEKKNVQKLANIAKKHWPMITQTDNQKYTRPLREPMTPPKPNEAYSEQKGSERYALRHLRKTPLED